MTTPKAQGPANTPPGLGFWGALAAQLPKLKTLFQLVGLVCIVAGAAVTHYLAPEQIHLQIVAACAGVPFLFCGLFFYFIKYFPEHSRVALIIILFLGSLAFFLALVVFTGVSLYFNRPVAANPPAHSKTEPTQSTGSSLELVDMSYLEDPEIPKPVIDVKVKNKGGATAFLTEAAFHVKKVWKLKPFMVATTSYVDSSKMYEVVLPRKGYPFTVRQNISHGIKAGEVDRFQFKMLPALTKEDFDIVGHGPPPPDPIYLLTMDLTYDRERQVLHSEPLLFMDWNRSNVYLPRQMDMDEGRFLTALKTKSASRTAEEDLRVLKELKEVKGLRNKPLETMESELAPLLTRFLASQK